MPGKTNKKKKKKKKKKTKKKKKKKWIIKYWGITMISIVCDYTSVIFIF